MHAPKADALTFPSGRYAWASDDRVPFERLAISDVASGLAAENFRKMLGRQAETRTDRAHVLAAQGFAGLDWLYGVKRTAKSYIATLASKQVVFDPSQGRPGGLAIADKPLELFRLERKFGVRPAVVSRQREMFLDDG